MKANHDEEEIEEVKKILIISYLFPPLGRLESVTSVKLVKYLPANDWRPLVLTVKRKAGDVLSLEREIRDWATVHRARALGSAGTLQSAGRFADRWLRVPDGMIGWNLPAILRGMNILEDGHIKVIYATQPYSSFLVGTYLEREFRRPLVLEYRDEWLPVQKFRGLSPARLALEGRIELKALRRASAVICSTEGIMENLIEKYPELDPSKFHFISYGYDPEDFEGIEPEKGDRFTVTYSGSFLSENHLTPFMEALARILDEEKIPEDEIRVGFYDILSPEIYPAIREKARALKLQRVLEIKSDLSYEENIRKIISSDLLLYPLPRVDGETSWVTANIYNYMASNVPILAMTPEGDAKKILKKAGNAIFTDADDVEGIKATLVLAYKEFKEGRLKRTPDKKFIAAFEKPKLVEKLASILDGLLH